MFFKKVGIGEYYNCNSRVKRLQLQVRRFLRRLVAVRVKATDEINFRKERETGDIITLSPKSVFCVFYQALKKIRSNFFMKTH